MGPDPGRVTSFAAQELRHFIERSTGVALPVMPEASPDRGHIYLGASPRGSLALYRTCQARAVIQGRDYVIPDDVKALAEVTLAHRLIVSPSARIKDVDPRSVVAEILDTLPVPGARVRVRG